MWIRKDFRAPQETFIPPERALSPSKHEIAYVSKHNFLEVFFPSRIRILQQVGVRFGYVGDSGGDQGLPDPEDSHVFGPPGSGGQRYGSGSFPFLIKVLIRLK